MKDENGLDCLPDDTKIRLNCSPHGMAILVDSCIVRGSRTLSLADTDCPARIRIPKFYSR